jgi:hypothetical protein
MHVTDTVALAVRTGSAVAVRHPGLLTVPTPHTVIEQSSDSPACMEHRRRRSQSVGYRLHPQGCLQQHLQVHLQDVPTGVDASAA